MDVNSKRQYYRKFKNLLVTVSSKRRNSLKALIKSLVSKSLLLSIILTVVLNNIRPDLLHIDSRRSIVKILIRPLF
jgi:hypothetical protein